MNAHVENMDHTTIITLEGELTSATTQQIQPEVLAAVQEGRHILLDMSHVNYLSSAGLRMLLLLYRRIRENRGDMALAGLSEEVRDIMAITGFLDLFQTYDSRIAGLNAIRKAS
jgi:anti-sigma B factor antagonist